MRRNKKGVPVISGTPFLMKVVNESMLAAELFEAG